MAKTSEAAPDELAEPLEAIQPGQTASEIIRAAHLVVQPTTPAIGDDKANAAAQVAAYTWHPFVPPVSVGSSAIGSAAHEADTPPTRTATTGDDTGTHSATLRSTYGK